jgi:phosphoadenosine phosphosulfate reductase
MNLKGLNRYQTFGFRRVFLDHFFENGVECFGMQFLGNRQYDALKVWLKEAEFLTPTGKGDKSGIPTQLCEKLKSLGAGNPLVWAIIWTNLAYNSIIVRWYMQNVPPGNSYDKGELVFMLGDDYSQSTRDNAVVALLETLRESPIGTVLKQGVPIAIGNNTKYAKQGWGSPDAVAILYALYRYAEATEDYRPTLTRFSEIRNNFETKGVDPVAIFGLNPEKFREMLQSIALQYDDFIRVTFVKDLDNITLNTKKTTLDVVELIEE